MRGCITKRCQGITNYNEERSYQQKNLEALIVDGKRAYANWTDADLERELWEYNRWLDERALEAQQAMDEDTEYQEQYS